MSLAFTIAVGIVLGILLLGAIGLVLWFLFSLFFGYWEEHEHVREGIKNLLGVVILFCLFLLYRLATQH